MQVMNSHLEDFGVLTLATPNDYLKAIGLALSLKVSNPGVPLAVACHPQLRHLLEPHFDHVVEEQKGIRGFAHKVYLDRYSPFKTTLFFDSDVLVFKPVVDYIKNWGGQPYAAVGKYFSGGFSAFGLDRAMILNRIGVERMVGIDGAGHALFRKPDCEKVFDRAREITKNYSEFAGKARYADEDVLNIVMTEQGLKPVHDDPFFSRYMSGVEGSMVMDARKGVCCFIDTKTRQRMEPCMMHFAADEAPIPYTIQLWKLFGHFGVSRQGLLRLGFNDFFNSKIRPVLRDLKHRLK